MLDGLICAMQIVGKVVVIMQGKLLKFDLKKIIKTDKKLIKIRLQETPKFHKKFHVKISAIKINLIILIVNYVELNFLYNNKRELICFYTLNLTTIIIIHGSFK